MVDFSSYRERNLELTKQMVKESVRPDNFIAQAVNGVDEINKSVNLLAKRLREWYELYNPEFSRSIIDHEKFVELISSKDKKQLLKEMNLSGRASMGADLSKDDLQPILALAEELKQLFRLKQRQEVYLEVLMKRECPNITAVAGVLIGAKLISLAGSLKHLSELPSSTVQLLGAEKALFRHLRDKKHLPPKYGILHEHPLIAKARRSEHGKIARTLADKISIAAKVDYFKGEFIGDKLKKDVEDKLK